MRIPEVGRPSGYPVYPGECGEYRCPCGLQVSRCPQCRTALDLAGMRGEPGRFRLAGATCQRLPSSRPRGRRVWPDENKAGVRGDCQPGGPKTIAIKGTWKRTAAQSCLRVRMFWDGRRLTLQTPKPLALGPAALHAKPWLSSGSWTLCKYPGSPDAAQGARDALRLGQQLPAGRPASALSWLYLSAGCLGVRGAPPAGCALSPCRRRRRREQAAGAGSMSPAPEHQSPPPRLGPAPGLRPRPSTLADNLAEPRGPTVVCTRAVTTAAPAASPASAFAAVVAVAADALHRLGSPDLSMGR